MVCEELDFCYCVSSQKLTTSVGSFLIRMFSKRHPLSLSTLNCCVPIICNYIAENSKENLFVAHAWVLKALLCRCSHNFDPKNVLSFLSLFCAKI